MCHALCGVAQGSGSGAVTTYVRAADPVSVWWSGVYWMPVSEHQVLHKPSHPQTDASGNDFITLDMKKEPRRGSVNTV